MQREGIEVPHQYGDVPGLCRDGDSVIVAGHPHQLYLVWGDAPCGDLFGDTENKIIYCIFTGLFSKSPFSETKIQAVRKFYIRVFGNVQAKDVCYRYNSIITKGNTVGLQQTIVIGGKWMQQPTKD